MSDAKVDDFPVVCETCLGENPFLRMTKEDYGRSCKICDRAFTIFRWRPGPKARFKKTEICQTCARLKNVCQTCVLDLQFGLPVQIRDLAMGDSAKIDVPKSDKNRDYQFQRLEHDLESGTGSALNLPGDDANPYSKIKASTMLNNLARRSPYFTRNLPHICSFFVRGECRRGSECPYRHEEPLKGELERQNIKDRFYGVNDPVALKMIRERLERNSAKDEETTSNNDENNCCVFVGGVDERFSEDILKEKFSGFGFVKSVQRVLLKGCAFVLFEDRASAEKAVQSGGLGVLGAKLSLSWAKRKQPRRCDDDVVVSDVNVPFPPGMKSKSSSFGDVDFSAPKSPHGAKLNSHLEYPSMDARNFAADIGGVQRRELVDR